MFERIAGYKNIKNELIQIRDWFLSEKTKQNKDIKLPKGILFYGAPGNGKTLFVKEYSESFGVPVINIEGNEESICREIHTAFDESKKYDFSIIIIDEIDQIVDGRKMVQRALKEELDGVNSNNNVLVLATTNSRITLDDALLRSGRFDRLIRVECPDKNSRKELLEYYIKKLNIEGNIDYEYLSRILQGTNGADITSILNDVLLRCGNTVTTEDIEESYERIIERNIDNNRIFDPSKANIEIAYHEIAHSLMIHKYKDSFYFYKATFSPDYKEGYTKYFPVDENDVGSDFCYREIEIALAGHIVTKMMLKHLDSGCINDLQKVRSLAVRLVNKLGSNGPDIILPYYDIHERMETEVRRRKNERHIERIIRKSYRKVEKYLKEKIVEIESLKNIMMRKGFITLQDLNSIIDEKGGDLISTNSETSNTNLVSNAITA